MHRVRWLASLIFLFILVGCPGAEPTPLSALNAQAVLSMYEPAPQSSLNGKATWIANATDDVRSVNAVSALSPTDVWAVGESYSSPSNAVLIHWDGANWKVVSRLQINSAISAYKYSSITPSAIAAITSDNVWVIGKYVTDVNVSSTLIAHWDGTTIGMVEHPGKPGYGEELKAITSLAPDNIWAVGSDILHFDGKAWSKLSVQEQDASDLELGSSQMALLFAIAAVSANDIWSVGVSDHDALTLHWDGKTWKRVANIPPIDVSQQSSIEHLQNILTSVAARTSDDVWAAGYFTNNWMGDNLPTEQPIILHWDGKSWTETLWPDDLKRVPDPRKSYSPLPTRITGIVVEGTDDLWVTGAGFATARPPLAHKHGQTWEFNPCAYKDPSNSTRAQIVSLARIAEGRLLLVGTLSIFSDRGILSQQLGFILDPSDGPCPIPPTLTLVPTMPPPPTIPPAQLTWPGPVPTGAPYIPPP